MITELKNEFIRVADAVGGTFKSLAVDELELYVQDYGFTLPLINMEPIGTVRSEIGISGVLIWNGNAKLQFLTVAELNSTEEEKDVLINQMVTLSVLFMRKFSKNEMQVFNNPIIRMDNKAIRFKTSNYCVGWEVIVNFTTGCNRL